MALIINNIPKAVSEVMQGINEGIEDVGSIVSNVTADPPQKVVFYMDAIIDTNSLVRKKIKEKAISIKTVVSSNIVEILAFNNNNLTGLNSVPPPSSHTTVETISTGLSQTLPREDQAIGVVLEYPGSKSS
jgi:hypothetical protein